ncbi:MAG TPA: hypothetical protein VFY92_08760, partial [Hyphomicrobiaceae bacterium]|nr:hypothetical protein [Hyphomicrobiaceae bacterium]
MSPQAVSRAEPHTVASFDTGLVVLANRVDDMGWGAGRALNALLGDRGYARALWSNRRSTG